MLETAESTAPLRGLLVSTGRLHAKLRPVIDPPDVLVGSMHLDPRLCNATNEIGVRVFS